MSEILEFAALLALIMAGGVVLIIIMATIIQMLDGEPLEDILRGYIKTLRGIRIRSKRPNPYNLKEPNR